MARTLNSSWLETFRRAHVQPRFLLTLEDGTNTWELLDGPCDNFTADIGLSSVDPIAGSLDPLTRELEIGGLTLSVDDDWLRDVYSSNRLRGVKATVKIGSKELAKSNFENYFIGPVESVLPSGAGESAKIEVLSAFKVLEDSKIVGYWIREHPLDVMLDIIDNKVGLDSSLRDASSFDPSNYTDISHFVVSRCGVPGGANALGPLNSPTSAFDLLIELAELLNGTLFADDAAGKLTFKLVDPTASADADWGEDTISYLRQTATDANLVNRVSVAVGPHENRRKQLFLYRDDDTDSQSDHAYPGTSKRILEHKIDVTLKWLPLAMANLLDSNGTGPLNNSDTSGVLKGTALTAYSGMREAESGPQPSDAQISSSRPMYVQRLAYNREDASAEEIIKIESLTPVPAHQTDIDISDPETNADVTESNLTYWAGFSSATRGALGTSSSGNTGPNNAGSQCVDITLPVWLAQRILERFGEGTWEIEVTTGLEEFGTELGDLVTITWPEFLAYNQNGLSGSQKWEVIGKETDPDEGEIRWVLASINTVSNTRSQTGIPTLDGTRVELTASIEATDVWQGHSASGLTVTNPGGSGLDIEVSPGNASAGHFRGRSSTTRSKTLSASKDTYIYKDVFTGAVSLVEVSNGGTEPIHQSNEVQIAKVVTDGSDVTSIDTTGKPTNVLQDLYVDTDQQANDSINQDKVIEATLGSYHLDKREQTTNMVANGNFSVATKG